MHPAARQSAPGILGVRATAYQVPGGELRIFTFTSGGEAREAATRVHSDGYLVTTASGINRAVDWIAPPHWFRDGREIAVYLGSASRVIGALTELAEAQFAGS